MHRCTVLRVLFMIRETVSSALAATASVIFVCSGIVGAATPWHGVVLAMVALVFGAVALLFVKD